MCSANCSSPIIGYNCTNPLGVSGQSKCDPICGDGLVSPPETCDTGPALIQGCNSMCNGVIEAKGYKCNGGNMETPTVCDQCGDGVVGEREICDDGGGGRCADDCNGPKEGYNCMDTGPQSTPTVCEPVCGDGKVMNELSGDNEVCDDDETGESSHCSATCDGPKQGYTCTTDSPSVCTPHLCGNGRRDIGETCDDGTSNVLQHCASGCQGS